MTHVSISVHGDLAKKDDQDRFVRHLELCVIKPQHLFKKSLSFND
jgi:hypothetical protein